MFHFSVSANSAKNVSLKTQFILLLCVLVSKANKCHRKCKVLPYHKSQPCISMLTTNQRCFCNFFYPIQLQHSVYIDIFILLHHFLSKKAKTYFFLEDLIATDSKGCSIRNIFLVYNNILDLEVWKGMFCSSK